MQKIIDMSKFLFSLILFIMIVVIYIGKSIGGYSAIVSSIMLELDTVLYNKKIFFINSVRIFRILILQILKYNN